MQHNRSGAAQLLLASPSAAGARDAHHHHHHHHPLHRHAQLHHHHHHHHHHQIRGAVNAAAAAATSMGSTGGSATNNSSNMQQQQQGGQQQSQQLMMMQQQGQSTSTGLMQSGVGNCKAVSKGALALALSCPDPSDETLEHTVMENPVVLFSVSSCCLCHVVKKLFGGLGVNPTVIELDEMMDRSRAADLERALFHMVGERPAVPAVFVGGKLIGGLDRLMAAHISGSLIPQLKAAGALWL